MFLHIVTALLCLIAGLACFAAMRDVTQPLLIVARRLTGVTLVAGAFYLGVVAFEPSHLNPPLCYFLGLLALAQLLFAMYAVLDPAMIAGLIDHHPRPKASDANHA